MKRLWCMWAAVAVLCLAMGEGLWRVCAVAQDSYREKREPSPVPQETEPLPSVTEPVVNGILPCRVQYTDLEVLSLESYSDSEAEPGTAALLVRNTGNQGIRFFRLRIRQGGRYLYFEATCLPPGGRILVPEQEGQVLESLPVEECLCMTLVPGEYVWNSPLVRVCNQGQFRLEVTNLSDWELTVRVWYKRRQGDLLLGSDSRYVTLSRLKPGESREVMPYGFVADCWAVVSVTAEETK